MKMEDRHGQEERTGTVSYSDRCHDFLLPSCNRRCCISNTRCAGCSICTDAIKTNDYILTRTDLPDASIWLWISLLLDLPVTCTQTCAFRQCQLVPYLKQRKGTQYGPVCYETKKLKRQIFRSPMCLGQ